MVNNMFKNIIENYINNMTIRDIIMFSQREKIYLEETEYLKIYNFIKSNWQYLLKDKNEVKTFLDNNFSRDNSKKIYDVFLKYQKKYSSYL